MGNAAGAECCLRRDCACGEECSSCLGKSNSLFGEDAFYRDTVLHREEDKRLEQARLKMHKGSLVAKYAAYELQQQAATAALEVRSCIEPEEVRPLRNISFQKSCSLSRKLNREGSLQSTDRGTNTGPLWWRETIPEWTSDDLPETSEGPHWCKGHGTGLKVRVGPNYLETYQKTESNGCLYEAISCDAIKANKKIDTIMGSLFKRIPKKQQLEGASAYNGFSNLEWTRDCPLPRVICINMMMPYKTGLNPWAEDPGCSFVGFFQIKNETLQDLQRNQPPPGVRLWKDFFEGPCGKPDEPNDPNRCLKMRVNPKKKMDQQAGLFKAVARCVNPEALNIPAIFDTYNGQPCLITKCGYIVKDPLGEWVEIGIDVRGFNVLARTVLQKQGYQLPLAKVHFGFMIQAMEDEDMPEKLLCDMYVSGINMVEDPLDIGEYPPTDSSSSTREPTGQ